MKYELVIRSRRRPGFIPHDLRYFQTHFVCQPMSADWIVPPAELVGKSYKAPDFVLWIGFAPVVSDLARNVLSPLCEGLVEFLPFHPIKSKPYFVMNVLNLDPRKSVHRAGPLSAVFVDSEFGALVRDHALSGVELGDPDDDIDRRVARGQTVNVFAGLVG